MTMASQTPRRLRYRRSGLQLTAATLWAFGCASAWSVAHPSPAFACTGPYCVQAEFFPGRGSVPANLPAVLFWPPARWRDGNDAGPDPVVAGDLRFVRLDAAGPVEVAFDLTPSDEPSTRRWAGSAGAPAYHIVPKSELQSGARYAVWARDCNGISARARRRSQGARPKEYSLYFEVARLASGGETVSRYAGNH